jgi:hypothetical protein
MITATQTASNKNAVLPSNRQEQAGYDDDHRIRLFERRESVERET